MNKPLSYKKIAINIAERITRGELQEGAKFSGRSLMGSSYAVSTETIRKALALLTEGGVIESVEKIGFFVKSRIAASQYLIKGEQDLAFQELKNRFFSLLKEKKKIEAELESLAGELFETEKADNDGFSLKPCRFLIPASSPLIGKSIKGVAFRTMTNATIVAIDDAGEVSVSPSAETVFREGMVLITISSVQDVKRIITFISG